ncbi:MAG TPA: hypothetical protein VEI03_09960 [Stellaceae bacterium]|nr:hypothetical protein [Stellaceae bacterium]
MARRLKSRDISAILSAAERWINTSLIEDRSVFVAEARWTAALADEAYHAFVEHPDYGEDDFMTKLKGQMRAASAAAQQLVAEMLWALLLFPSRIKPGTKRQQIRETWALSGQQLTGDHPLLADDVLVGVGSGGPGFNTHRPNELEYLIALTRDLKRRTMDERRHIFRDYDAFICWIATVPQQGHRQFRHMLRFFAFPDRVERISSNNDRRIILDAFAVAPSRESRNWSDKQLDDALQELRARLEKTFPSEVLDFYEPPLRTKWSRDRTIKTGAGEVTVTVPSDDDEQDDKDVIPTSVKSSDLRQSLQIQSKLAEIGAIMGFKIWVPRADRSRIRELAAQGAHAAFLEDLPLNYEATTLDTIEQIDVLWLKGRAIARAFEVEHTTAVYSGLLRMADLLALQPNMDIRLHIVAPDERREKVFREMLRPVFSLLDRGPLSRSCTFISYESVEAIRRLEHLAHTNESIIAEYEEQAEL